MRVRVPLRLIVSSFPILFVNFDLIMAGQWHGYCHVFLYIAVLFGIRRLALWPDKPPLGFPVFMNPHFGDVQKMTFFIRRKQSCYERYF